MAANQVAPETVFLECYLTSGNVHEAARKAGLSMSAGYDLRDQALEDDAFSQKRQNIRKNILPDAELMGFEQLQLLADEIKNTLPVNPLEQFMRLGMRLRPLPDPRQKMIANLARLIYTLTNIRRTTIEYPEDDGQSRRPTIIEVHPTARAARLLEGDQ